MERAQGTDSVSIVIPTGGRSRYVERLLDDLAQLDGGLGQVEALVVDDAWSEELRHLVDRAAARSPFPLRYVKRDGRPGLNPARNTGIASTRGQVIVFLDDDCRVPETWLRALWEGIDAAPEAEAFGGPIHLVLPPHPRWCRRCHFPVTSLDRGTSDRWVDVVYGANFGVRRSAIERIGPFNEAHGPQGDEIEWLLRLRDGGGMVRYVAAASVGHAREADDVRLGVLLRTEFKRGLNGELLYGAGPAPHRLRLAARVVKRLGHAVSRRCLIGVVQAAGALGALVGSLCPARARRGGASG